MPQPSEFPANHADDTDPDFDLRDLPAGTDKETS